MMSKKLFCQKLGEAVASIRNDRHLTQEELASLSNINRSYLTLIENGKTNPTLLVLRRITRALGIKMSDLFYWL